MQNVTSLASDKMIVSHDAIRKHLEKVLSAEPMRSTEVLTRFLQFVVEETLQGRKFEIKEYTIGVNVFKRSASFAPQVDAIVRISAGRLRRMLSQYYSGAGRLDDIKIEIPKGTYVPVFEPLVPQQDEPDKKPAVTSGLTVAVLPFTTFDRDDRIPLLTDMLAEQLCSLLYSSQEFSVIAFGQSRKYTEPLADFRDIGKALDTRYLVKGYVSRQEQQLRVDIQLLFADDATVAWSASYTMPFNGNDVQAMSQALAQKAYFSLGSLCGAYTNHLSQVVTAQRSQILGRHEAIYWLYLAKQIYTPDVVAIAQVAVERIIQSRPYYSTAWAVQSQLLLDHAFLTKTLTHDTIVKAQQGAEKCLSLNPRDQHGCMALAHAHLAAHDRIETLSAIERGLSLGIQSLGLRGFAGIYLICAGEYEEGAKQLQGTCEIDVYHSWFMNVAQTIYYFHKKEYQAAYDRAKLIKHNSNEIGEILRRAAAGKVGIGAEESRSKNSPDFPKKNIVRDLLATFLLDEVVIDDVLDGLQNKH